MIPLLLTDRSISLRYLVHRHLLDSDEAGELRSHRLNDPIVKTLIKLQRPDGSWDATGITGNAPQGKVQTTSQVLTRLGYLELDPDYKAIKRGIEYLFSAQDRDGSWPLGNYRTDADGQDNYDTMSLQTSLPLRGIAATGHGMDPRAETAYDWLIDQRLDDGAWPTGMANGVKGYVAGYRRMPHSRWGCRSNTTAALTCLSLNPGRARSDEARRALDLLLGRETRERYHVGFEVARTVGVEESTGFITYHARFDMAHILKLCNRTGVSVDDPRVQELVDFVLDQRNRYGLWEYTRPQASRWVTYDLLRTLGEVGVDDEWVGMEPRTPFQPYPKRRKRF